MTDENVYYRGTTRPEPPYDHDYSYDINVCPDCGGEKRRLSKRCQWCDVEFRLRLSRNMQEALNVLRDGGGSILRFSIPPDVLATLTPGGTEEDVDERKETR
jgi:hypothetical protein